MKRKPFLLTAGLLLCATSLLAHDLFLRPDSFFLRVGEPVRVRVLNGTFTASEGAVAPNRLRDLSLAGPAGRTSTSTWSTTESRTYSRRAAARASWGVRRASATPST